MRAFLSAKSNDEQKVIRLVRSEDGVVLESMLAMPEPVCCKNLFISPADA